jgi:uncharacterized protein (TIGR03435 family)
MRLQIERTFFILLGIGFSVMPIHSQTKPQKPSFEIVSVKPSAPGPGWIVTPPQGDRLTMSGVSLRVLMAMAYRDSASGYEYEVFGGPDWIDSGRYDVQAKADCSGGIISRDQQALMIQSMLEERFELKARVETRDMPIYNLVVSKDGPKLKASADQTPPPPVLPTNQLCSPNPETFKPPALPPMPPAGTDPSKILSQLPRGMTLLRPQPDGSMTLQGGSVAVSQFVFLLKRFTGRQVIDKTGFTSLFDFALKFSTDGITTGMAFAGQPTSLAVDAPVSADPAPSLFSAIQDLGLKLEQARGPVQVVVIDSVTKPSEN